MPTLLATFCYPILALIAHLEILQTTPPAAKRTDWMKGRYGLMVHWQAPDFDQSKIVPFPLPQKRAYQPDLDKAVDGFDLDRFLRDFDKTGAQWLIFTIGQSRGTYASPNRVIDSLAGPGHTSRRDLVLELAKAMKKRGKKFIAYLSSRVKNNTTLHKAFAWNTEPGTDQAQFQELYLKAVREWSVRFGENLDGWWFDGCYPTPDFSNNLMKWDQWYAAARAGNSNAILTFNDGSFCVGITKPIRPEHDYTSGEVEILMHGQIRLGRLPDSPLFMPATAYAAGTECLNHALVPIDSFWSHHLRPIPAHVNPPFKQVMPTKPGAMEPPLYSNEDLQRFVNDFTKVGGAVTLNVGIYQEGGLGKETIKQLRALNKSVNHSKK